MGQMEKVKLVNDKSKLMFSSDCRLKSLPLQLGQITHVMTAINLKIIIMNWAVKGVIICCINYKDDNNKIHSLRKKNITSGRYFISTKIMK